ncbi:LytTR family DNA-binding domain-containing protein [Algoriphagus sp. CAU 1675]|uniref:LytR/AlgR family response regulator transcription factor n=1 Tax=Algoriphagus sp. CAU 1675 TaxID=3032597 RepID=UPI0023DC607D|nr:LytTR family DNA-binding domain-containing protein [Algoriphagus sp. CAU 1675]MDF2159434.1 LytTR family DNA-binding domain-containing protein [Algoriphagus sp. CAU 1675]
MEEILRIGLLDDEEAPRILLTEIISMIPGYTVEFSTPDPLLALKFVLEEKVDVLITDIMIPGFSGLELSKKIAHLDIPVIICSAHDRFGVDSFKVNAIYFILKPPSFFEVSNALQRARNLLSKRNKEKVSLSEDMVLIKQHGESRQVMLRPAEIQYLEQKDVISVILLDSGEEIRTRSRFSATLERVQRPYLVRIHRSYAVNYLKLKAIDGGYCLMENGAKVPIGKEFRQTFYEFLETKTLV